MRLHKPFSTLAVVLAFACALPLAGCKGKPGSSAILATVEIEASLSPTCVVFEVSSQGSVRFTQTLAVEASKKQLKIGIEQGDLPGTVQLRAFASHSANGCDQPRLVLSASKTVDGTFPTGGLGQATLTITAAPPQDLDADGDTHVAATAGGDDCNDNDGTIHPGASQSCTSSADTDCNGQAGCLDAACASQGICASGATSLAFNTNPITAAPGSCAGPVTVGLRNAANMPVAATAPVTVTFTTQPTGISFWSDSACTSPAIAQTIATNQSAATVYFSGPNVGSYLLDAAAPALTGAQQTETLSATSASKLAFSSPPRTVVAGACSAELDLETRDANDARVPVVNAMQVALTASQSGVAFYADATCATALPGNVLPFAAGTSSAKFYAKATASLATMVTASFTGLTPATQALTVTADAATHLVFVTQQMGVASSQCSGAVLMEARDAFDNPAPPPNGQTISMSETGVTGFSFFTDASCTTALTGALPFTTGTAQAHFYFQGSTAGTATMTADASPAFTPIVQDAVIGVGPPASLVFTSGPQSAPSVTCSSAPVVVQVRDATGNPVTVTGAAIAVTLSAAPGAGFTFYADAGCATALTGNLLSIPAGTSSASFWFKGASVGPVVVTAASTPLMQDMQTESIVAGPPTQLVFSSPARTSPAGQCTQFDLAAQDSQGNAATVGAATVITLASTPATVNFFNAPGCALASAATSVTMPANAGTVSFYASGTTVGAPQLTATAPFGPVDQTFTVEGGAPTALAITTPQHLGVLSGVCSGAITLELHDAFGNVTNAPVQTDITLASGATVPLTFYPGSSCSGSPLSGTASIGTGSSSITVSFIGSKAESFTLSFTSGTLTPASQPASISAGAATQLVFTTPSRFGVAAGLCSPVVTIERRDAAGNPVGGPALSLNVTAGGSAALFTDSNCLTGAGGLANFGAGMSGTDLYFKDAVAEGFSLGANGAGVGSASQMESVTGGGPSQLVYLTGTQSVDAGVCSGVVTVQRQDMGGNPSSPSSATTVGLSWGGTGTMGFFSDPTCATSLTGNAFDIQANQSSGQFYFASNTAETNNLTASANLLSPAIQQEVIRPGPAVKLAFSTTAQTVDALVCSAAAVSVQSQDTFGNAANPASATSVSLTASGSASPGTFSTTPTSCSPTVTSVPITGNTASFYFFGATSGTLTIGAQASGLGAMVTQDETVRAAPAKQLTLASTASPAEAGACAAVTVTRRDQNGNPTAPNNATTVTLSVLPATGLSFFSDSGCTNAASTVSIASGQAATTYYLKGITGGTGTSALTYSLGATAPGLSAGALDFDILQMVRRGTVTLANNSNTGTGTVLPAIPSGDISRTFLVYQGSDISTRQDRDDVECHLTSASGTVTVNCTRQGNPGAGASPAVTITWQTVSSAHDASVAGGFTVQHVTGTFANNATNNPVSTTISTVDTAKTFVISGTSEGGATNRAVGFMTTELGPSGVQLTQGGGGNKFVNDGTFAYEVVTMNGATVNRGTLVPSTTTGGTFTAPAASPDLTRTALLYSARTDDSGAGADAMCKRRFRGAVTSTSLLTFTRGNGVGGNCTNNNVEAISWEELIFPSGTLVQPVTVTVNGTSTSGSGALNSPVDTTRTVLFMGGHGPGGASAGETGYMTSDSLGAAVGTPTFASASSVGVSRPLLVTDATVYTVFAVELDP